MKKSLAFVLAAVLFAVSVCSQSASAKRRDPLKVTENFIEICNGFFEGDGYTVLTHDGTDISSYFFQENKLLFEQKDYVSLWNVVLGERYIFTWGTITQSRTDQESTRSNLVFHVQQHYYWLRSEYIFFPNHSYEAMVFLSTDLTVSDGYNTILGVSNTALTLHHLDIGAYYESYVIPNYIMSSVSSDKKSATIYSSYFFRIYTYTNWFELMDDPWAEPELGDYEDTQSFFSLFTVNYNGVITYSTADDTL